VLSLPEIYVPRTCSNCGNRLRKLKTNRTLHISGRGPIEDYGMYFTNTQQEVTNVFGFYKCTTCGKVDIYELEVSN
jgi:hypothetical protein